MADKPTIVDFPVEKDELSALVEQMKRSIPIQLEYITLKAKLRRATYEAMMNEGFTEEQAFDACMEDS